ncbi:hypothetical protein AFM18_14570 [Achromobacter spanius]|uniref:Uncharacterized protein n=1 Tax=Achromobacter spanius TaxID=217203 RepID=A0AAW3I2C0_9BURK|nr:hypothetical protein AFM18_14570 [Achromobacter spanius]
MNRIGDQILQMMIHQPMSRYGGEPREARRYDVHAIVAGAVFTAFVAGMQMRVVQDVQRDGVQGGQALPDQGNAVGSV